MAEKFKYGPLIYNSINDESDEGNYWWPGNPPVAYEAESGPFRIPVDANGNQCLPGESILHPNCRVEKWESFELCEIPSLSWCREWFEDNFLIVSDYDICRYILRWCDWNYQHKEVWKDHKKNKTIDEMIGEIWPDVQI
jgi:hypothetical protein